VIGKKDLRAYFAKGLEAYPDLHFVLKDIMWGIDSIVLYYRNQKGTHTGEYMEISAGGLISRVVANYSG
jgi:predicted ester cyclase